MKLPLLLCVCLLAACTNDHRSSSHKVAILKLGAHELIDQVETATVDGLRAKYGENIAISVYNGNFQPETLRQSVNQIVHSGVDVAVPITTSATAELVNAADGRLNVVFSFVSNPEEVWGKGKTRPAFLTGTSDQIDYLRNVQLIRAFFPSAHVIGYLVNESEPNAKDGLAKMSKIAPQNGFTLNVVGVSSPADVANSARSIVRNVDVFLVGGDNTVVGGLGGLLGVAEDNHIPVFAVENMSVKGGALAAYGIDYSELGQATAEMVIDVLEGGKPGAIPVNYFSKTKLFINTKAFTRFGLEPSKLTGAVLYEQGSSTK